MELVPVQDDAEWDGLLADQADGSLYHTTAWLRFQAGQFGFDLRRLAIHNEGRPVGLFPLFLTRRGIFRISSSPRGVDYLNLGPLVRTELLPRLLDCYERWARRTKIDYTSMAFLSDIDENMAAAHGYEYERHLLCTVDLREGEDAVFKRLKTRCRTPIRKAGRLGVKIVEGDLTPYLDRYLALSDQVYAKSGTTSPLSKPLLSGMLDALGRSGRLLPLRAEVNDQVAAMCVVGHYGATAYLIDAVSDRALSEYSANNGLIWHAMAWSCRRGLETFDLGGARIPSLARFKLGFGGVMAPYANITKAHGFFARSASRAVDAVVSRIRARRFFRSRKGELSRRMSAGTPSDDASEKTSPLRPP